jgi:hypothetical protein
MILPIRKLETFKEIGFQGIYCTAGRIIRRKLPVSPIVDYKVAALPFMLYLAEL